MNSNELKQTWGTYGLPQHLGLLVIKDSQYLFYVSLYIFLRNLALGDVVSLEEFSTGYMNTNRPVGVTILSSLQFLYSGFGLLGSFAVLLFKPFRDNLIQASIKC